MKAIEADSLQKVYRVKVREAGLKAAMRALTRPEYQSVEAVKGVSFSVEPGERLAFIGPNGAGKSTTIKMLTGILHPTSGSMSVLGFDPVRQRRDLSYRIGTVFGQKSQLWFHLPPSDSFELLGAIYDIEKAELRKRIKNLAERFELGDLMKTPVRKMSLGQRMRCEVAASLLHEPDVLFLDEPTIGLDVLVKQQIRERVLEMNRERGVTVFLTSHDAGDIEKLCKRTIVIDHGTIVLDQPVKELKHRYFSRKVVAVRFSGDTFTGTDLRLPEGVVIEKRTPEAARLGVDTAIIPIDEAMRWLVGQGVVTDITVEDPPMEQVIASIFSEGVNA